jgi:hypothetical protein
MQPRFLALLLGCVVLLAFSEQPRLCIVPSGVLTVIYWF